MIIMQVFLPPQFCDLLDHNKKKTAQFNNSEKNNNCLFMHRMWPRLHDNNRLRLLLPALTASVPFNQSSSHCQHTVASMKIATMAGNYNIYKSINLLYVLQMPIHGCAVENQV